MEIPEILREQVLKNVIDDAPFPIGVYVGYDMKIVLANKCMVMTYGKGPDVIGKNYTDILPELENQLIFEQLRAVLATGIPFEAKNARVDITVGGVLTPHFFNYNFTPIYDASGTIYGVMNTAAEVTELNLSRLQTAEAEKQLRHAVESAEIGTFEKDMATGHITGSPRFYEIWEVSAERCDEQELLEKFLEEDIAVRENAYERFRAGGKLDYEIRIRASDKIKYIRVKGSEIEKETGKCLIGVVQDITEQKLFAQKLSDMVEERTGQLQRSNDDLRQLGHVLSHDLKEPIRKISMFSNMLRDTLSDASHPKTSQYIGKIQTSADRVYNMVDSILLYSSMDGQAETFQLVDISAIIKGILEDFELVIEANGAQIEVGELPSVSGSATLLHQLFHNLLGNALKFTHPGVTPEIIINGSIANGFANFDIRDNGIGIDQQYLMQVFAPFQRLHSKDEFEGTGLGLSLCKKIVERHKGTITAEANTGGGAVFRVTLPVK